MRDVGQALNDAYNLIESGDNAAARRLLQPFIDENSSDPDVWWVYAHAVDTHEEGRLALDRLITLSPNYPDAQRLRAELAVVEAGGEIAETLPPLAPSSLPDIHTPARKAGTDDYLEDAQEERESINQSGMSRFLLIAAALLAIFVIGLLIVTNMTSQSELPGTPTSVANLQNGETAIPIIIEAEVTEVATDEPDVVTEVSEASQEVTDLPEVTGESAIATEEIADAEATVDLIETDETPEAALISSPEFDETALAELLMDFNLRDDGISIADSELGSSVLIDICDVPSPTAARNVLSILELLSGDLESLPEDVDGLAVQVFDCEEDRVSHTIGISRADAQSLADGEIDLRAFEALLRPV